MALKGLKVIELAGLLPAPYCGLILADFGASVIRVDKIGANTDMDSLSNGKKSISLNLKHPEGSSVIKTLIKSSDVIIEPFRKGVMEKLGLGPDVLLKENPRLIYARLTGYGQTGLFSERAGHDINYVAMSGILSLLGRHGENPLPPVNILADLAGGGLMCALGILLALIERNSSGLGQVIDNSMVEGTAYLSSWMYRSRNLPLWGQEKGKNILDTGSHFYEVYETKDGKYVSVGALEPQFYEELLEGLQISEEEAPHFVDFENSKKLFAKKFLEKTRDEWCQIFDHRDACVAPVLSLDEAPLHVHNSEQNSFVQTDTGFAPNPAPKLSRTPGQSKSVESAPKRGEHTNEVLNSLGYSSEKLRQLENEGIIECHKRSKM